MTAIDSNFSPLPATQPVQPVAGPPAAPGVNTPPMFFDSANFSAVQNATPVATSAVPFASDVPLSDEEKTFMAQGLLGSDYPALKAAMATGGLAAARAIAYGGGLQGPFAGDFGNPNDMLNAARQASTHPELLRMYQDVKKGDILLIDYNNPHDMIVGAHR
jgi:hypothetical protein